MTKKIPLPLTNEQITDDLNRIKATFTDKITREALLGIFSSIDLTTLNTTDTVSRAEEFTNKVNHFPEIFGPINNVAAICVYPNLVFTIRETLKAEGVRIASVAGGFPSSMTSTSVKIIEVLEALNSGADEIDIVFPLWSFLDGDDDFCFKEINDIKRVTGDKHLKVILESGVLRKPDLIWSAALISLNAGANFIKTSTGKMSPAATPEAAIIICRALKYWHEKTGEKRGFKPAGGISTAEDALLYYSIVNEILGKEWLTPELFRIGASRLSNNILSELKSENINYF